MIGETISHYRVLALLGAGGMGEVYKAEDTRLRRPVALKLLRPGLVQDPDAKARLVHEAQAASALDHPNICTIHNIDETPDGHMFVAMAFYEGETLKQRIGAGPMPIDDAIDIVVQVARAVAAAHDAGIIHRDIKPANIMLTRRGEVKLLDFGVAKLVGQTALTRTGTTLGTVAYMAPEQFTGVVDRQSDVWALGVVLYECLTGRLPFAGEHELAIMRAITDDAPRPLREPRPDVLPALERVIAKALQKDPRARYASADDFVSDLQALRAGPATATVATAAAPAEPLQDRRRRVRSAVLAVFAVALLGAALWVGLRPNERAPSESAARPVPITRFPGLEVEPAMSPKGDLVAFAWDGKNEDNFDIYVRSIDGKSAELRLTSDASPDHAPAWSPNGLRIAFIRVVAGRRVVMVVPALGGPEERLFEAWETEGGASVGGAWSQGGWSYGLSWTPDGEHLVFGDRNGSSTTSAIHLHSLKDGQRRQLTRPPQNLSDVDPVVSPDGRYLAFVRLNPQSRGGNVFLQKLEHLQPSGEPTQLTFGHRVEAFDWTHDSRSVVHDGGSRQPGLWRVAVAGGASELVWANVRAAMPSLARSGAGVVYQTTVIDSNIWEQRLPSSPNGQAAGTETFRLIASTSIDGDMKLSPDGTRIAFVSGRSGHSDLWVSNRDGSQARQLTNFEGGRAGSPAWSADGRLIAFDAVEPGGNWSLYVVAADSSLSSGPVVADRYNNSRPAWSLDGKWIYFASDRTGDYQIWKMPSAGGAPEQVTRNGGRDPIVSPDGRHLYYAKEPPVQGIWVVPFEGGPEVKVVERGRSLGFDVADTGIFIMDASAKPHATVEMFSFASRTLVPVAQLPADLRIPASSYLNVTRDGRSMLYVRYDQWMSDIEMLPGFR